MSEILCRARSCPDFGDVRVFPMCVQGLRCVSKACLWLSRICGYPGFPPGFPWVSGIFFRDFLHGCPRFSRFSVAVQGLSSRVLSCECPRFLPAVGVQDFRGCPRFQCPVGVQDFCGCPRFLWWVSKISVGVQDFPSRISLQDFPRFPPRKGKSLFFRPGIV